MSHERTITIEAGGDALEGSPPVFHVIPTVVQGRTLKAEEAAEAFSRGEIKSLGEFPTQQQADTFAVSRSRSAGNPFDFGLEEAEKGSNNPFDVGLDQTSSKGVGSLTDAMRMLNVGFAEAIGLPFDAAAELLALVGIDTGELPSKKIQRGLAFFGIGAEPGKEPQSMAGSIGRGAGLAMGTAAGVVASGARLAGTGVNLGVKGVRATLRETTKNIVRKASESAISHPLRFIATEAAAGAGAGLGGFLAEQKFPGSLAARAIGELIGGVATMVPLSVTGTAAGIAKRGAMRIGKRVIFPFTESGGKAMAGRRLQSLSGEASEEVIKRLNEEDILPGVLTPAQRTGQPRLLSLEKEVLKESAEFEGHSSKQIAEANRKIREQILHFSVVSKGTPEATAEALKARRDYLRNLLKVHTANAAARAEQKLAKLKPNATSAEAADVVRGELEEALRTARAEESRLHGLVPRNAVIETDIVVGKFAQLFEDTPIAQRRDIPAVAKNLLFRRVRENGEVIPPKIGDFTTSKELIGLRTALLEDMRQARAAGNFNKARIAGEIAQAVLDTINSSPVVEESFTTARNYSLALNDTFTRGPVGRLLRMDRTGGPRVPSSLTLEGALGSGGQKAATTFDALMYAVDEGGIGVKESIEDFLRASVTKADGTIDPKLVRKILEKQSPLFDRLPELRQDFEEAILSVEKAAVRADREALITKRLEDRRVSAATTFIKAEPGKELEAVMRTPDKVARLRELSKQVRKDPSGLASKGLKLALVEYFVNKAHSRFVDEVGEVLIDGAKLNNLIKKDIRSLRTILNDVEIQRFRRIATTAERLLQSEKSLPEIGGISVDLPTKAIDFLVRTAGARFGAKAAHGTTGATILTAHFGAQRFQEIMRNLTRTKAEKLLIEATFDAKLYKALFTDASEATAARQAARIVSQKINAFFGVPLQTGIEATDRNMRLELREAPEEDK